MDPHVIWYCPIGSIWPQTSADWAAWVGGIGTAVAVIWTAGVYWMDKLKQDKAQKTEKALKEAGAQYERLRLSLLIAPLAVGIGDSVDTLLQTLASTENPILVSADRVRRVRIPNLSVLREFVRDPLPFGADLNYQIIQILGFATSVDEFVEREAVQAPAAGRSAATPFMLRNPLRDPDHIEYLQRFSNQITRIIRELRQISDAGLSQADSQDRSP